MEEELIIDDWELELRFFVQESEIHGKGVFARQAFNPNEYLGNYHGPVTRENDTYVLWVEDENDKWIGIDGQNLLRYLNHSHKPNAEFYGDELYALTTIEPDDEITFDYGEEFRAHLHQEQR